MRNLRIDKQNYLIDVNTEEKLLCPLTFSAGENYDFCLSRCAWLTKTEIPNNQLEIRCAGLLLGIEKRC